MYYVSIVDVKDGLKSKIWNHYRPVQTYTYSSLIHDHQVELFHLEIKVLTIQLILE